MTKTIEIPTGHVAIIYTMTEAQAELCTKAALKAYESEFNATETVEGEEVRKWPLTPEGMAAFSKQKAIDYYADLVRAYQVKKAQEAVVVDETKLEVATV